MKAVAKTVRENKTEMFNYFDHGLTNTALEGMNSIIQLAKKQTHRFNSLKRFRTIVHLNWGKPPSYHWSPMLSIRNRKGRKATSEHYSPTLQPQAPSYSCGCACR